MDITRVTSADLDWIVGAMAQRRTGLLPHAPVFWRPAVDADVQHGEFLGWLLREGQAFGYRTARSVMVLWQHNGRWEVDDFHVPADAWDVEAYELWQALAADKTGEPVQMVCPVYEPHRSALARDMGLELSESWWLRELNTSGGDPNVPVDLPGARARMVTAPPEYAPPGPLLMLDGLTDPEVAMAAAVPMARELGCAGVVVRLSDSDQALESVVGAAGLRRHSEFYTGILS